MDRKYLEAISFLAPSLKERLTAVPHEIQIAAREVCLRAEKPLALSCFTGTHFMGKTGGLFRWIPDNPYIVSKADLDESVRTLTEYSLHTFRREINAGFLTVKGGHRAGVSGSAVCGSSQVISVTDISSVNLRIAREIKGAALSLAQKIFRNSVHSTLIAGTPSSGKTTLLKDLTRLISSGSLGYFKKVSLIDERGELAAVYRGVPQNDVGALTDVFDGYRKGEGMMIAIRSMSPEVIVLDEIAGEEDARSIRQSLNAGAAVIATVHAASLDELYRKEHIRSLITEGAFRHIVLLEGAAAPCQVAKIATPKELTPLC